MLLLLSEKSDSINSRVRFLSPGIQPVASVMCVCVTIVGAGLYGLPIRTPPELVSLCDVLIIIWGPTFTLIGPKVFGNIFVGELVLETGSVITEILHFFAVMSEGLALYSVKP